MNQPTIVTALSAQHSRIAQPQMDAFVRLQTWAGGLWYCNFFGVPENEVPGIHTKSIFLFSAIIYAAADAAHHQPLPEPCTSTAPRPSALNRARTVCVMEYMNH